MRGSQLPKRRHSVKVETEELERLLAIKRVARSHFVVFSRGFPEPWHCLLCGSKWKTHDREKPRRLCAARAERPRNSASGSLPAFLNGFLDD